VGSAIVQRPILPSVTLFALSGLYPAIFKASHNWFAYTTEQLQMLVGGTVAGALLLGVVVQLAGSAVLALPPLRSRLSDTRRASAKRVLAALISLGLTASLMLTSLAPEAASSFAPSAAIGAFIGAAALWIARSSLGPQLGLMLLLSGLAAAEWGWSYSRHRANESVGGSWHDANRSVNDGIEFARTPNVYTILLESYQSPRAMEMVYGLDIGNFVANLERRSFHVAEQHFSNYPNTVFSLSSMMAMEHHHGRFAAGKLDAIGARELIGGKYYNAVLDVFGRNGYETQYILNADYVFIRGDALGFAYPERTPLQVFKVYQLEPLNRLLGRLDSSYGLEESARMNGESFSTALEERLEIAVESNAPHFSVIKPAWTDHSHPYTMWHKLGRWPWEYRKSVKEANPKILGLVDLIIERDPTAIIVMTGDHGGWRWRNVWLGKRDLNATLRARPVDGETLAQDLFGVFFGIRGAGEGECVNRLHSSINVFRCIFSELAEDDSILSTLAGSESLLNHRKKIYVGARDGEALSSWQVQDSEGHR